MSHSCSATLDPCISNFLKWKSTPMVGLCTSEKELVMERLITDVFPVAWSPKTST